MSSNRRATIIGYNIWYMAGYPDEKRPMMHLIKLASFFILCIRQCFLLFLNAILIVIINCQVLLSVKHLLNVYSVNVDLLLVAIAVLSAINA